MEIAMGLSSIAVVITLAPTLASRLSGTGVTNGSFVVMNEDKCSSHINIAFSGNINTCF